MLGNLTKASRRNESVFRSLPASSPSCTAFRHFTYLAGKGKDKDPAAGKAALTEASSCSYFVFNSTLTWTQIMNCLQSQPSPNQSLRYAREAPADWLTGSAWAAGRVLRSSISTARASETETSEFGFCTGLKGLDLMILISGLLLADVL